MIRRYHRWLSVIFGIFLIWIAATGLLSHGAALYRDSLPQPVAVALVPAAQAHEGMPDNAAAPAASAAAAAATPGAPAGFVCPENMTCRAKPAPDSAAAWVSFFHHLHAGEEFGAIGTTLSILSGFALLFFAISGLWMYLELYRGRLMRTGKGANGGRFFWK